VAGSREQKPSLTSSSSVAGLLARLLPVIESLFVVNARNVLLRQKKREKEQAAGDQSSSSAPVSAGAAEEKEKASEPLVTPLRTSTHAGRVASSTRTGDSSHPEARELARVRGFVEAHRLLLKALLRQNLGLLDKTLASLVQIPACRVFLDFENKKTYFRA
jgi:hypothetical protein